MGHSQAQKQQNHDRIVDAAIALFRIHGLGGIGVAEVMRTAGLTHGGFYSHFDSRDALVAEALTKAFAIDERRLEKAMARTGKPEKEAMIEAYLTPVHRDSPGLGCTAAALVADIARGGAQSRTIFTEQMRRYAERVAAVLPEGSPNREADALFAFSALVGALLISRAVDDPALSDAVLEAARERMTQASRNL